jgi:hypothetical protein
VYAKLMPMFPPEYAGPVEALSRPGRPPESVVALHSLLPGVMEPMFTALARLMSPDLPLTRRQHEMINTVVSGVNRCRY